MTSKLRWVWDETATGLAFNGALAAVASLGHIHREPSWQPARIATLVILLAVFAVTMLHLEFPGRPGAVFSSFRKPVVIGATLALALGVLALGLLTARTTEPASSLSISTVRRRGRSVTSSIACRPFITRLSTTCWSCTLSPRTAGRSAGARMDRVA